MKQSYSNHPFSGAFSVSFREGKPYGICLMSLSPNTVDGSEILRSPLEVGSYLSHYLRRFFYIQTVVFVAGFFSPSTDASRPTNDIWDSLRHGDDEQPRRKEVPGPWDRFAKHRKSVETKRMMVKKENNNNNRKTKKKHVHAS